MGNKTELIAKTFCGVLYDADSLVANKQLHVKSCVADGVILHG